MINLTKINNNIVYIFMLMVITPVITMGAVDTTNFNQVKDKVIILKKINDFSSSVTSIESDFIQKKKLSYLAETVTSKGVFCYKKLNKIRWEYFTPFKYLIVLNNDKYFIKDGKSVYSFDVKTNQLFSELNDVILGSIKGDIFKNENNFKFIFYENNSTYQIRIFPLNSKIKEIFKTIEIYFTKNNFSLAELHIIETSNDKTYLQFINQKYNSNIKDEIFNIK